MSGMESSFGNRTAKSTRLLFYFFFFVNVFHLSSLFRRVCERSLLLVLSFPSACLCVCPMGRISVKFYTRDFYENLPTDSKFG